MKHSIFRLAALGAASALALSACSKAADEKRAADQTNEPANVAQDAAGAVTGLGTGATGAVSTEAFLRDAAMGDMYEIEAAKMALARSQNSAVKQAAEKIMDDHKAASEKLKALAATNGWTLPTALDERRKGMLDNLRGASAADFDDRYLDQQTMAHHEALTLFNGYARMGDNAALKGFAAEVAPKLETHAQMVTKLDRGTNADDEGGAGQ